MGQGLTDRVTGLRAGNARGVLLGAASLTVVVVAVVLVGAGVTSGEVAATVLFLPVFAAGFLAGRTAGYVAAVVATLVYVALRRDDLSSAGAASSGVLTLTRAAAYLVAGHVGALAHVLVPGGHDAAAGSVGRPARPAPSAPERRRQPRDRADAPERQRAAEPAWNEVWDDERRTARTAAVDQRAPVLAGVGSAGGGRYGPRDDELGGHDDDPYATQPPTTMSNAWPPEPPRDPWRDGRSTAPSGDGGSDAGGWDDGGDALPAPGGWQAGDEAGRLEDDSWAAVQQSWREQHGLPADDPRDDPRGPGRGDRGVPGDGWPYEQQGRGPAPADQWPGAGAPADPWADAAPTGGTWPQPPAAGADGWPVAPAAPDDWSAAPAGDDWSAQPPSDGWSPGQPANGWSGQPANGWSPEQPANGWSPEPAPNGWSADAAPDGWSSEPPATGWGAEPAGNGWSPEPARDDWPSEPAANGHGWPPGGEAAPAAPAWEAPAADDWSRTGQTQPVWDDPAAGHGHEPDRGHDPDPWGAPPAAGGWGGSAPSAPYDPPSGPRTGQGPSVSSAAGGASPGPALPAVDPETGLWTAKFLRDRLSSEQVRSRRSGRPFSLVLVQVPDGPLAQLPYRRQLTLLRELGYQFVAGGVVDHLVHVPDQAQHWFAVILPDTDRSGAQVLERRLRLGIGGYLSSRGLRLRDLESASLTAPDDDPAMGAIWDALIGPDGDGGSGQRFDR